MSKKEVLVDSERMYALTQGLDGRLYLEVVCGGLAMENIVIALSRDELDEYERAGKSALDTLALRIAKNRRRFADRIVDEEVSKLSQTRRALKLD